MEQTNEIAERRDGIQQIGRKRWEIFFGFDKTEETRYCFRQIVEHRPTTSEARQIITDQINAITQEHILQGMEYNGRSVWLSAENQRNIAFAYALAKGGDMTVPLTLKLGTDDDYELHQFADSAEVVAFAVAVQEHIEKAISAGRQVKEETDWSIYEIV